MKHFVALSVLTLTTTTMVAQNINYPKAPKDGTVDTYFGVKNTRPPSVLWKPIEVKKQPNGWLLRTK